MPAGRRNRYHKSWKLLPFIQHFFFMLQLWFYLIMNIDPPPPPTTPPPFKKKLSWLLLWVGLVGGGLFSLKRICVYLYIILCYYFVCCRSDVFHKKILQNCFSVLEGIYTYIHNILIINITTGWFIFNVFSIFAWRNTRTCLHDKYSLHISSKKEQYALHFKGVIFFVM